MKTKPLIYLALILVVLAGLKLMQGASHDRQVGRTGLDDILAGLQGTEISRMTISGPTGPEVILSRGAVGWVVESSYGHPADTAKIDRIVAGLGDLSGEFRSNKSSVLADYALDDAQAIHLKVEDQSGAERAHLLLGNRLAGGSGYFVRKAGDDTAYAAQGNLIGDLGVYGEKRELEGKRFCDLKALSLERGDIDRLTIAQGDDVMTLTKSFAEPAEGGQPVDRSQYEWLLDGQPVKKSIADGMAGALAGVWARDLLDPGVGHGFAESRRSVEVAMLDGGITRVEFGETLTEPEAGLAMRIAGRGGVFLVPDYLNERLFKGREELLTEN